jgi:hypothetical protein
MQSASPSDSALFIYANIILLVQEGGWKEEVKKL